MTEPSNSTASTSPAASSSSGKVHPSQDEMPFAVVYGKKYTEIPQDLYIPPDALEIFLEAFEGPLDLLLYLIRRQNLDILDIDVARITEQYVQYVEAMQAAQFELAAEYLVMAALLAEIKSRMLLPKSIDEETEEEDPRALLILRLQEYERYKEAAESIDKLPRINRDLHLVAAEPPAMERKLPLPDVPIQELMLAFAEVMKRADMFKSHQVSREKLSTRERMGQVLDHLQKGGFVPFVDLFRLEEGKLGVVVTFLALMELIKESLIDLVQNDAFGPIHIKARSGEETEPAPV